MSHTTVVTVSRPDRDSLAAAIAAAPPADLVEVRLDALWNGPPDEATATDDLLAIIEASDRRLLATLRPRRQGGAYEGPEEIRINLLLAAARVGFAAVDLENDQPDIAAIMAPFRDGGVVLSDHRLVETPSREVGMRILQSMQDAQATYDKLAFPAPTLADGLRALELAHSHAHRTGHPAIAPIGADALLRALLPLAGSHATYGHDGNGPVVPGQPALADVAAIWQHWGLTSKQVVGDAGTGWYAVLGEPVEHSLSPRIHNAMFLAQDRKERFGALTIPDSIGAMRLIVTVATRIGLRGGSITMPLKQHALAVTQGDEVAQTTGAANCFRVTARGIESTNTDATAMRRLLDGATSVAVIGAGGAARAAIWAALDQGIPCQFTCRDPGAAEPLQAMGATWIPWEQRGTMRGDAWVQATPLGAADGAFVDAASLAGASRAIELVYAGGTTPFEQTAQEAGLHVTSGQQFLIEQALDAYTYWTGTPADRKTMEAALP